MTLNDVNDYLDEISPKHYRQFRLLYNELLGYIDRDEHEKINEFKDKLHHQIAQAEQLKVAMQERMNRQRLQDKMGKKWVLHQQFRQPKKTIVVTHPFPLKAQVVDEESIVSGHRESTSTVDEDKKLDQLIEKMTVYNQSKSIENMPDSVRVSSAEIASTVTRDVEDKQSRFIKKRRIKKTSDADEKGVSSRENLSDQRVKFRKKKEDDIKKATPISPVDHKGKGSEGFEEAEDKDKDSYQSKKKRIWERIDDDRRLGDVNDER